MPVEKPKDSKKPTKADEIRERAARVAQEKKEAEKPTGKAAEIRERAARVAQQKKTATKAPASAAERVQAARKAAEEKARTYVVKSGDSLSKIAKEIYGDASRWPEIFEANKDQIKDPNLIYPGQEFRIP